MKCRNVQEKLSAYQDGELQSQEQEQIAGHLRTCQACREQYAELDRVWQTLGGLGEIHPDPLFYRQRLRRINEPREQVWLPALRHVFQVFRSPVIASVIVFVGLVAGSYLGRVLARHDLFPSPDTPARYSQEAFLISMNVFDPAPPGTFAEGYLRMVTGAFPASPAL